MIDINLLLSRTHRIPIIYQDEAAECGLACLAMIASYHGHHLDLINLRARFKISLKGTTLATLLRIADELDLDSRPIRCEIRDLERIRLPIILHWDFNHFVVLASVVTKIGSRPLFRIHDPAVGSVLVSQEQISKHFTGVALELAPSLTFRPKVSRSKISITQLWNRAPGLASSILRILFLSIIMQIFSLASPFYMQIALDSIIPSHDISLLGALALGFGVMAVLNQITTFVRSWAVTNLSNEVSYKLTSNIFRHLVKLPLDWFQKRTVGDVISRFNSSQAISQFISNSAMQIIIDVAMMSITLLLMIAYSPTLSGVSITCFVIYALVRFSYFGALKARNVSIVQAQAKEQALLIETIRGMAPIRLLGGARERVRVWQSRKVDYTNSNILLQRTQAIFTLIGGSIIALENVIFVYLVVKLNFNASFSIGMIAAFGAYKQQFFSAGIGLVGAIVDFRMLDVQLNRIGDIVLTAPERNVTRVLNIKNIENLELRNVGFSYGSGEPNILENVNLVLNPGEIVALVGPSGAGKSTILRIILALNSPSKGMVLVNSKTLSDYNVESYREKIGCILQDDHLFAGSIFENISFFDACADLERVKIAARLAHIHEEIIAMPMGYESLVGDMGSTLSGGQKQRVLIARALYRTPDILVMDEATSHLDSYNEEKVNQSIRAKGIACVIAAHRPSTIAMADRVFEVIDGKLIEREHLLSPS